jgi:hypothetical protein
MVSESVQTRMPLASLLSPDTENSQNTFMAFRGSRASFRKFVCSEKAVNGRVGVGFTYNKRSAYRLPILLAYVKTA